MKHPLGPSDTGGSRSGLLLAQGKGEALAEERPFSSNARWDLGGLSEEDQRW